MLRVRIYSRRQKYEKDITLFIKTPKKKLLIINVPLNPFYLILLNIKQRKNNLYNN
jgi:hypothetical protein